MTSLTPKNPHKLHASIVFRAHFWFTDTGRGDDHSFFISNTVILTKNGCEELTHRTPETLQVRQVRLCQLLQLVRGGFTEVAAKRPRRSAPTLR